MIGVQQNAVVRVLCGHLLAYLPPTGYLEGEVSNSTAPEADFVDTCRGDGRRSGENPNIFLFL